MTNLLLVIGSLAFLAYGYWLMGRIDRFFSDRERQPAVGIRLWDGCQNALLRSLKHIASRLPAPRCPEMGHGMHETYGRKSQAPCTMPLASGNTK